MLKNSLIGSVCNSTIGSLELIVGVVEVSLQLFQLIVRTAPRLCVNDRHSFLPDLVHTHHSVKGLARFLYSGHYLIFTVEQLTVYDSMSEISHSRVGGNDLNVIFAFLGYGDSFDLALDFGYSRLQLFGQRFTVVWNTSSNTAVLTVPAPHALVPSHCSEHHVGVVHEILIARYTVSRFTEMHP